MRKFVLICGLMLLGLSNMSAQEEKSSFYGIGNRVGVGVGVGTEGIGIDGAVSLTKYFSARFGVNFMPDFNINADVDVTGEYNGQPYKGTMEAKASLARTTVDLKLDVYPLPGISSFFITGGFSFGGSKLFKITGHDDKMADLVASGSVIGIDIDKYHISVDENGNVEGGVEVSGFRPYLGLGFGRLIPKNRIGFRFEIGAQFHGKPKVYAAGVGDLDKVLEEEGGDDISKLMDKLSFYPVIKFSLRGRIL